MGLLKKIKKAWDVFISNGEQYNLNAASRIDYGFSSTIRPDRPYITQGNERSIVNAIINRIAIDCSMIQFGHVKLDDNNRFSQMLDSDLNDCLRLRANKDQISQAFIQDIVMSMMNEGVVAVVPTHCDINPQNSESYKILDMRTGRILQWFPNDVEVELYNDETGYRERVIVPKSETVIIENPFYSVMNTSNSTYQRLVRKLNLLDAIDNQSGSGKLDLIIQLPYVVKTDVRKKQADQRREDIENQLANSKYGIAYTDGTEKITQLNRPVENNLMNQITFLTSMLFSQLTITESILNGTADEKTMTNYYSRTIKPIVSAIANEFKTKFLSKTAITKKQTIMFFNDPFSLVPLSDMAELSDKLTRNAILSANEIRQIVGFKPVVDPKADQLINNNINHEKEETFPNTKTGYKPDTKPDKSTKNGENQNG